MHNSSAFRPDLQNRDHVMLFNSLLGICRKLPSIRRILLSLDDDHVKHEFEHVKLNAITSDFARNFLAQARSPCDLCFAFFNYNFIGTF